MARGVCSFRTNPQCALFPTSSRKTKVRPPYILQQWEDYLCKLLNWFTSYLQFSKSVVFSLHCLVALYPQQLLLLGGVPACMACTPSSKILISSSIFSADILLFLCDYIASQISVFVSLKVTHLLFRRTSLLLLVHMASFQTLFYFFFPLLTIHPSWGLLSEKFSYMAFKKWMKGRKEKNPIPFSNQFHNPYGIFALSFHLSQLSLCILETQDSTPSLTQWYVAF